MSEVKRSRMPDKGLGGRKAKRLKGGGDGTASLHVCFEIDDIVSTLFSFLDVKSLFAMTKTRKSFMNVVRHEHVVRSALMQGGHSKRSMERLIPLIEKRSIWTPSPMRLLRLMNGKRCERCNQQKVNMVSDVYGVFFCFHGCIPLYTKLVARNKKWSNYIAEPRVAQGQYSSVVYLWTHPYKTSVSHESCGPLITMKHDIEPCMKGGPSIAARLQNKDAVDKHAAAVPTILKVYRDSTDAAERRREETLTKKRLASVKANQKRKEKYVAMIENISNLLGDHRYKTVVLSYTWERLWKREKPRFECGFVAELLTEYINAPSKATKRKQAEVASVLKDNLQGLESKFFFDFGFLSASDPFQRAIKEYCLKKYPDYALLHDGCRIVTLGMIQRIRDGDEMDNIEVLEDLCGSFAEALAPTVVASSAVCTHAEMQSKLNSLACLLWRDERRNASSPQACLATCIEKLPDIYQSIMDFLASPEALEWKQSDELQRLDDPEGTADSIIDKLWTEEETFNALLSKKFKYILQKLLHRDYLWSTRRW